jgi:hypothetical protein
MGIYPKHALRANMLQLAQELEWFSRYLSGLSSTLNALVEAKDKARNHSLEEGGQER